MAKFLYGEIPKEILDQHPFLARLPAGITNYCELGKGLDNAFSFPYSYPNWNALLDCLRDFEWIENKNILLLHSDFPLISTDVEEAETYISILLEAIEVWEEDDDHDFIVVFPEDVKNDVDEISGKLIVNS